MSKYPELDNKEWLVDQYCIQELPAMKIAETVGCANNTVLSALSRHSIDKRSEKTKTKKGDGKEVKKCVVCGNEFTAFQSASRKFCSLSCSSTYNNEKRGGVLNATCQHCGKRFHARESELIRGRGKYCSEECCHKSRIGENSPAWNGGKITIVCKQCGKIFESHPSQKACFCSRKCHSEYHSGDNAPNWKGGISFEPYCQKFNEAFKESIREKFGRVCFLCPTTEEEQMNAMRSRGKRPFRLGIHHVNYNKDCLCDDSHCEFVPLCTTCHSKTNNNRDYWENLIMEKLEVI